MNQKWICLALAGALALSLCACKGEGAAQDPTPTPYRPEETVEPTAGPSAEPSAEPTAEPSVEPEAEPSGGLALVLRIPRRDYQPWQEGYMKFLTGLLRAENSGLDAQAAYGGLAVDARGVAADFGEPMTPADVMAMGSENYTLYDVDEDGVPELFVKYGNCEAAYTTQCYTWRDGQVVCIGEFSSGHSSLYAVPDKNTVLRHEAHMGYAELYEYPMERGVLTEEREIFSEEDVPEYTAVDEIVPGAELLDGYYTELCMMDFLPLDRERASAGIPRVLPICDWGVGPAATGDSSEGARTAVLAALGGETQLYGVSGDGFYGDMGWAAWEDCVQPGGAYPYNDEPFQIVRHVWQDMNGDGQEECVLRLETGDEYPAKALVVLSEQGGTVFAYYFGFYDEAELGTDGVFRHAWGLDGYDREIAFWENQCYEYAARGGGSAQAVEWLDGPPQG